ncbi:MAG: DinB family protein [Bacteroidota bacterium]
MPLSADEYHPYYGNYINLSGKGSLVEELKIGANKFHDFVSSIPEDKMNYSYDEGKWTIAELLMHLIDAERIFQHRAFRFARNDKTPLPGFEQNDYVPETTADLRIKKDILDEFVAVRNSSIRLFRSFNNDTLKRMGTASGSPMSVRALGRVICGHQVHHFSVIRKKYL